MNLPVGMALARGESWGYVVVVCPTWAEDREDMPLRARESSQRVLRLDLTEGVRWESRGHAGRAPADPVRRPFGRGRKL